MGAQSKEGRGTSGPVGAGGGALTWTWPSHACPAVDAGQPGGYQLLPSPASSSRPPARDSTGWEELGHIRALGPPVRPLWNVSMAILACGQLEPLFNLNGGTEPKNAGTLGKSLSLKQNLIMESRLASKVQSSCTSLPSRGITDARLSPLLMLGKHS